MAPVAENRRPGDSAVVAFSTEIALDDLDHVDIVGSLPHFKNCGMADFALESDSMKPMWKNDRRHSGFFGVAIEGKVTVFGFGNR